MLKGEIMVKLILQIVIRSPAAMKPAAWSAVISLLLWARSRGVLPVALALTSYDVIDGSGETKSLLQNIGSSSSSSSSGSSGSSGSSSSSSNNSGECSGKELLPTVYARECFLRAYGLVFESMLFNGKRNQQSDGNCGSHESHCSKSNESLSDRSHGTLTAPIVFRGGSHDSDGASGSSASWMSSIGGFLWSATANPIESNPLSAQAASSHAASQLYALQARQQQQQQQRQGSLFGGGTGIASSVFLEVPDIYRNLNAGLLVDVQGNPLRPDDELLKVCLRTSNPDEIFYLALSCDADEAATQQGVPALHSPSQDVLTTLVQSLLSKLSVTINKLPIRNGKLVPVGLKFDAQWGKMADDRRRSKSSGSAAQFDDASISSIGFGDDYAAVETGFHTAAAETDVDVDSSLFPELLLGDEDDIDAFTEQLARRHKLKDSARNLVSGVMTNSTTAGLELDCVAILEWISIMIFSSRRTLVRYWAPIFGNLIPQIVIKQQHSSHSCCVVLSSYISNLMMISLCWCLLLQSIFARCWTRTSTCSHRSARTSWSAACS